MAGKKNDKSTWAIGGGLLIGIGVGFFFHTESAFSICWIYVGRIRHRAGDNCPNFNEKRVKIKLLTLLSVNLNPKAGMVFSGKFGV